MGYVYDEDDHFDERCNARARTNFIGSYATNVARVFAAGDIQRGQSLIVGVGDSRRPASGVFGG